MNRRQVIGAAALGMIGLSSTLAARGQQGQQPNPTAEAIQTQIAVLEATLTSIAGVPSGTPTGPVEFEMVDEWYGGRFRITVGELEPITETLYDNVFNKTLRPRGMFVAVHLGLTNIGTEPVSLWADFALILRDDRGRSFSADPMATLTLTFKRDLFVDRWQPDITYPAIVVWDVATDAQNFTLGVENTNTAVPVE